MEASQIKRLAKGSIFGILKENDTFVFSQGRDGAFEEVLTADDVRQLARELVMLASVAK